jgi:hypothetical protein
MNRHATALANIRRELDHCATVAVYFAQSEWHRTIKIGFSTCVPNRLSMLTYQKHTPVTLLGWVAGGPKVEREMHAKFDEFALGHEWFNPAPELLTFIETSTRHDDPVDVISKFGRITDWSYDSLLSRERVYADLEMNLTG